MTAFELYENEIRTLEAALASARVLEQSASIRLRNAQMTHAKQVKDLSGRVASLETDLRTAASAEPAATAPAGKTDVQIVKDHMAGEVRRAQATGAAAHRMTVNVGLGPDFYYGSQHHKDIRVMEQIAMKNASVAVRDVIARSASNLLLNYREIQAIARASGSGLIDDTRIRVFRNWVPRSLLSLARVVADQAFSETDAGDALNLYRLAIRLWGASILDQRAVLIFTELLEANKAWEEFCAFVEEAGLASRFPVQTALLRANVSMRTDGVSDAWLTPLNEQYVAAGVAPVSVEPGDSELLSRLRVVDAVPVQGGPLVTIMMPTFNGSAHIATAINSVLGQTWKNLELIVVDDFSDPAEWDAVRAMVPEDDRLTLVRLESNQGAYRARLRAFSMAQGEFVAVHDDDDWSHPQKIETQVRALLDDPDVIANMSNMTRIDQDGLFVRINDNPEFNQKNYSSMMIRADDVRRLGLWDDLNRAADAEFHDRIFAVTGKRVVSVPGPPLSFMRSRTGSLTSGEIRKGALDFGRQTYGLLYQNWHLHLKSGSSADAAAELDSSRGGRPFPVPENLLSGKRKPNFGKFDVIYCTDFRFPGGNSSLTNAELRAAKSAGLRVGVLQLSSPVLRAPRPFSAVIAETIAELDIPVVAMEDAAATRLLLVRNPTVLVYADNLQSNISADRTLVVANTAPMSVNGTEACYDLAVCRANAEAVFGAEVTVTPESPHTRKLLRALSPDVDLASFDWPGFIPDEHIASVVKKPSDRRPVLGRHSRDHRLKWPDTKAEIAATYAGGEAFETRILGGADTIKNLIDLSRTGATVHPFGSLPPRDFVNDVDFWVYMHSAQLVESFGMAALEAMSAGCVVVLPPYMEELFGRAAVYATTGTVRDVVQELWGNPAQFARQSEAALTIVQERFSTSAYVRRLKCTIENRDASVPEASVP